ncbi:MAG: DUF6176 family protein [Crocosphaera sp.]|nr:DUF6176 family protein [Crocosphaera sp.]
MLQVVIKRIKPGKEEKLRNWLTQLAQRADEVRATFKDETVRAEQAYLIGTIDGPILVYVMEAEDFSVGAKAFAKSVHPIDHQHRQVMAECLGESVNIEPLFDISIED